MLLSLAARLLPHWKLFMARIDLRSGCIMHARTRCDKSGADELAVIMITMLATYIVIEPT